MKDDRENCGFLKEVWVGMGRGGISCSHSFISNIHLLEQLDFDWDSILYSVFVASTYSCTYIWQLFIIFGKFYIVANFVTSTSQSCLAVRLKANSGGVKSRRIDCSLYPWPKMHQHYIGIHTCQGASGDCQNFSVHFSGRSNHFSEGFIYIYLIKVHLESWGLNGTIAQLLLTNFDNQPDVNNFC